MTGLVIILTHRHLSKLHQIHEHMFSSLFITPLHLIPWLDRQLGARIDGRSAGRCFVLV
jgi:hypothetical protein